MHLVYEVKPVTQVDHKLETKTKGALFQRMKLIVMSMLIIILLIPTTIYTVQSMSESYYDDPFTEYTVSTGDTLWKIALEYAPEKKDIRDYIERIRVVNELETSMLTIGQKLRLP